MLDNTNQLESREPKCLDAAQVYLTTETSDRIEAVAKRLGVDFTDALDKIVEGYSRSILGGDNGAICGTLGKKIIRAPLWTVTHLEAMDKYVVVHHDSGELVVDVSLKTLLRKFPKNLVRAHRGSLVNVERITCLLDSPGLLQIELDSGAIVAVSRRQKVEVKKRLLSL